MNASGSYFFDILLLALALHFTIFLTYGRITHKPLPGYNKYGGSGHKVFDKLTSSNKYLIIATSITIFLAINAILDAREVLHGHSPHSILIAAPVMVVLALVLVFTLLPLIFKKMQD